MLSSHELARMLLSHRDTDVVIEVLLDEFDADLAKEVLAARGCRTPSEDVIKLRDSTDELEEDRIPSENIVQYDSLMDALVIKAGTVVVVKI